MSETETADDPDPADADSTGVPEVLDALAPLTEDMDTSAGFAVKHGRRSEAGRPPDPNVVEVRITLAPPRHPKEVARARRMLQRHGFDVQKERRGGEATVRTVLRVRVGGEREEQDPHGDGEQSTF